MERRNSYSNFMSLLRKEPNAWAYIKGSNKYPSINGYVRFYDSPYGVFIVSDVGGLPAKDNCNQPVLGFHIHEGANCTGNNEEPFLNTGAHYNPKGCNHPYHSGDMPPLFSCDGFAFSVFLTNRFTINEIIGKSVIIHSKADDFTTQPSGGSGEKIACGIIR